MPSFASSSTSTERERRRADRPWSRFSIAFLILFFALGAPPVSYGQSDESEAPRAAEPPGRRDAADTFPPPGMVIDFTRLSRPGDGSVDIEGPVTMTYRGMRFQADRVWAPDESTFFAEGDVLVVWGQNRISGSRLEYDLDRDEGTVWDAIGEFPPDFQFVAASVRKVGPDLVYLRKATITTCTQPTPYWSFRVSRARIRLGGYAHMYNARLRSGRLPFLYFPYLFWPVKDGRAPGLLIPEFGNSRRGGRLFRFPVFVPLGRSADVTLTPSIFSFSGVGLGTVARAIPNDRGQAKLDAFYINDEISGTDRYRATYEQTQEFSNGFRLVADINVVSDFDFFNDYERDLELTSTPNTLARLEMSRNGPVSSLNVRQLRREQLFSDGTSLVQSTYPEIEWRGRSFRLGESPVYLSWESSFASIQQSGFQRGAAIDVDYLRADLFPTLTVPFSPAPWLDVNPRLAYRYTYWTDGIDPESNVVGSSRVETRGEGVSRGVGSVGVEFVGPKVFRIFGGDEDGARSKFKHTIEPIVTYAYSEGFEDFDRILLYDEIDRFGAAGNSMTYGIRSRLFARRPRAQPEEPRGSGEAIVMPNGVESAPPPEPEPAVPETDALSEPVEIASVELRQSRSFDRELSFGDLDADGVSETSSSTSDVVLRARYNPSRRVSLDLRSAYQVVYREISNVTLSGNLGNDVGNLRFSIVHRNGLGVVPRTTVTDDGSFETVLVPRDDDTQLQVNGGFWMLGRKLRFDLVGTIDADPEPGGSRFPERLWRVQYSTQCCTMLFEQLTRTFARIEDRDEFSFRVDLRGIGKFLEGRF